MERDESCRGDGRASSSQGDVAAGTLGGRSKRKLPLVPGSEAAEVENMPTEGSYDLTTSVFVLADGTGGEDDDSSVRHAGRPTVQMAGVGSGILRVLSELVWGRGVVCKLALR